MERPKVGIGVIVKKDNKILFLKRKNKHGENTWCFAGGHLEFNETFEQCALREIEEEIGIQVKNFKYIGLTNDMFKEENKHYITIFLQCDYDSGELEIREPHKCTDMNWFEWDNLPAPLFLPIKNLIKQGFNPMQ